jgi:small GTP-binding protein
VGIPEKIKAIEDEIHKTQINKATEHHIGLLKAKIARLRREMEENTQRRTLASGGGSSGFDVRKGGDATVILIGLPSVGKSTLLNRLTNAKSRVASYQFTTLTAIPGMMHYRGSRVQILDMPGIIEGAAAGKGLGKKVLSIARTADLILIVLDVFHPQHLALIKKELFGIGIRIDSKPPDVVLERASSGGLSINFLVPAKISEKLVQEILHEYGVRNCRVIIREKDLSVDQLIDVLSGNRAYMPSLTVLNKIDLVNQGFIREVQTAIGSDFIPIAADAAVNIDALKEEIYNKLDFIRIYMREKGKDTDFKEPMIMQNGASVEDVCNRIHRTMVRNFRYAQVWGRSVKFGGQKVGMDHLLIDEDIITITKRM